MTIYVRLLSKKEGRDWSRRQSFGMHSEGDRTIADARMKAMLAAITWQRVEPETEFKIEVSDQPWR